MPADLARQGVLSDIRILKLAEMYERSYEDFVLQMAQRHVFDEAIREKLSGVVDPSEAHGERIAAQLTRLNARLGEIDRVHVERAALQDVLEVERSARSFYLQFVEEIRDPEVADLFRALAREEAHHIRLAEDAIQLHDRKFSRSRLSPEATKLLRIVDEEGGPAPGPPASDP